MEPAVKLLLPQVKEALICDSVVEGPPTNDGKAKLIPEIRDALRKDEQSIFEQDAALAARLGEMLPRLAERLRDVYAEKRGHVERDYPWTLQPLDWEMDLLGGFTTERSEVAHTQCLAYLLDSKGSHGLGTRALREFFRLLGRLIPGEDLFERLSSDNHDAAARLRHVRVFAEQTVEAPVGKTSATEARRCDLWLELVEEGRALVVVIENKIDAGEHSDQLAAYEQAVWRWARRHRRNSFEQRLVLLTPDGRAPEGDSDHEAWLPVSYKQLAAALAQATRDAAEPGKTFLALYVSTILKAVLGLASHANETDLARRLPYLHEVIAQGVGRE